MPKLTALTTIEHDGVRLAEGDTFVVEDKAQVAQLVEAGAAEIAVTRTRKAAAAEPATPEPVTTAQEPEQVPAEPAAPEQPAPDTAAAE